MINILYFKSSFISKKPINYGIMMNKGHEVFFY